jgi:superfamily I DNA/RNA helicase
LGGSGRAGPVALSSIEFVRYRAVLVDEAQDFDTDALRFCVAMLEDRPTEEQDLLVVSDSAQKIYRRDFTWKGAGIRAQGRTQILRVNYRNTNEILRFAHSFLAADPALQLDEAPDLDDELSIVPAESAERSGVEPVVALVDHDDLAVDQVVETVMRWYADRRTPRSIAVLTTRKSGVPQRVVEALQEKQVPVFWATDPASRDNKDLVGSVDLPVIVSTIHSAKGLEFPRVVVCDSGSAPRDQEPLEQRKTIYVGLTRATEELVVVARRASPLGEDLRAAGSTIG